MIIVDTSGLIAFFSESGSQHEVVAAWVDQNSSEEADIPHCGHRSLLNVDSTLTTSALGVSTTPSTRFRAGSHNLMTPPSGQYLYACPTTSPEEAGMSKQYRLPYLLKAPSEETENMYLAEVPVLPGCRAWGATADEALFNLEGVAADYIASCEDHGDHLPAAIAGAGELVVAV